jgi:hypothetical protein
VTDKGSARNPAKDAAGAKGTGCINPNNRPFDSHPSQKIQAAINQLAADLKDRTDPDDQQSAPKSIRRRQDTVLITKRAELALPLFASLRYS